MALTACPHCGTALPADAQFCAQCGAAQRAAVPPLTSASLRPCPNCGVANSAIAKACTNCFQPLDPLVAPSGPELKPPSRGLVWFLMVGAGVLILAYFVAEILIFVFAPHSVSYRYSFGCC